MSIDAAPKPFRGPWEGDAKIVIGIDIGTTQSGVAFSFLQNGAIQVIHRVTRWPGQEAHSQQGKIPTLVWYDTNKKAVAFGAEAQLHTVEEQAEDNGWFLAKHFKLHLHPNDMRTKHEIKLDDLPPGVSFGQIYSDFLGYLLQHTKSYFEDRILDGKQIWERYSPTMEVVIAHPNGWGIREQTFLRSAAVAAGFTTTDKASSKVRFVTEAEASVHFCIYHTNLGDVLQPGTNFAVCDAGGSTVDTTLYSVVSTRPVLKLKEKRASACVQAGAIFVDFEVEKFLHKSLTNAELNADDVADYTKAGVKDFEGFTKRAFKDDTSDQSIAVAHTRFNNASIRARRGRMTLSGSTIKGFFDVCVKEITASVDQQLDGLNVPYILLVGGFGDSPYIRGEFKRRYEPWGSQVTLTNDSTSKAVADGAVIWSTMSNVCSRAPRYSFGAIVEIPFLPKVHRRQRRLPHTCNVTGQKIVSNAWSQIVQKDVALDSEVVSRRSYHRFYSVATPNLQSSTLELFAYSGHGCPEWAYSLDGKLYPGFQGVCTIRANLENLQGALRAGFGGRGFRYWSLKFDVCIRFGGTELESYMEWEENARGQAYRARIDYSTKTGFMNRVASSSLEPSLTFKNAMSIDSAPRPFRGPWEGDTKIVVGIDIGTTQSGVAFAFLQNGAKQEIHRIISWPGQEAHNQQSKIPTLVWYDTNKRAVSFGAEAQSYTTEEQAEDNGWALAK